jgi:hypothetical protein
VIRKVLFLWATVLLLFNLTGCALKWQSALRHANENYPTPQSNHLLEKAHDLYEQVNGLEKLTRSIEAYQTVLLYNHGDYQALVQLSNQYILMGTAYSHNRNDKSAYFKKAMRHAELAMYTNTAFKTRIRDGSVPWEAVDALNKAETEAMFFWVTALQYEFKEGMSLAGKIRNVEWMARALIFLDRIEEVNPDFGGGAVEFAKAICYYVLPKFKGGSKVEGEAYMHQAVARGKARLLPRWGRGKYFYTMTGNREKAREDLSWVSAQNLEAFEDPYPWRVFFQEDARAYLK